MNREKADKTLEFLRELRGNLADSVHTERWLPVWVVMAIQLLLSNGLTQILVWMEVTRIAPFALVWGLQIIALYLTIKYLQRNQGGQRSRQEDALWWIWSTFLVAAVVLALVNAILNEDFFSVAPFIAVLAACCFTIMAGVVHRAAIIGGCFFAVVAFLMAIFPKYQFLVYGIGWALTFSALAFFYRPRSERDVITL